MDKKTAIMNMVILGKKFTHDNYPGDIYFYDEHRFQVANRQDLNNTYDIDINDIEPIGWVVYVP